MRFENPVFIASLVAATLSTAACLRQPATPAVAAPVAAAAKPSGSARPEQTQPTSGQKPGPTPGPTPAVSLLPVPQALGAQVQLELVTDQSKLATALVAAPEPKGRLFVVEKNGLIRILKDGKFDRQPFLDLRRQVVLDDRDNGEQGLLGLAFHPQFASNGRFYVNYTSTKGGATRVEERRVGRDKDRAGTTPVKLLLHVEQPYSNHNAGDLTFGPDGKLYVGLGDGGAANDPHGHGQNPQTLLGSFVRIDVEAAEAKPQTVAIGLRNPWRFSFDSATRDLYIADVGQNKYEYVHVLRAAQLEDVKEVVNLGWNVMEGFHCFTGKDCDPSKYQAPLLEYPHQDGCSITGGYVYRGKAIPALHGHYFYSDYCTALLRSFVMEKGAVKASWDWKAALDPEGRLARVSSFGQDQDGELYVVTHEGPIYKLVPKLP